MVDDGRTTLEELLKRRAAAEALPPEEMLRWQRQYNIICNNIKILQEKLNPEKWDVKKALGIVIEATAWLDTLFNNDFYKDDYKYFDNYPELKARMKNAAYEVGAKFKQHDIKVLRHAIKEYKETMVGVNEDFKRGQSYIKNE